MVRTHATLYPSELSLMNARLVWGYLCELPSAVHIACLNLLALLMSFPADM